MSDETLLLLLGDIHLQVFIMSTVNMLQFSFTSAAFLG